MESRRYLVNGRVQGVFFRASARRRALSLGLGGYAANLPDGRVEVIARGAPAQLDEFARWLAHGPPGARVDGVAVEPAPDAAWDGFAVLDAPPG